MAVLLGAIGAAKKKYQFTESQPVKSYVWIHQFIHKTIPENNKFYVVYYLYKDGRFLKGLSPIFKGTYENGKFICVKEHPRAIIETEKKLEWFSCLITNTHKIKIGKELFWDWEDYIIKLNKYNV
jgi:hypothetical protein